MIKNFSIGIFIAILLPGSFSAAQEVSSRELRSDIDSFSLAVEEALDLNQGTGLFGMNFGEIDPTYLYGQGILLEVRTTLANKRNRSRLSSLNSVMRQLQADDAFERLIRGSTDLLSETKALNSGVESFYGLMMDRIAKMEYSPVIRAALQQASDSARSLSVMGDLDDKSYEVFRSEFGSLRQILDENEVQLEKIKEDLSELGNLSQSESFDSQLDIRTRIEKLEKNTGSLRARALEKAEQLRMMEETAEQAYVTRWESDVVLFEKDLYRTICRLGSILDALPLEQRISVLLKGLGEESEVATKIPDKLHILLNQDIQECQSGNIGFLDLFERSRQYSY